MTSMEGVDVEVCLAGNEGMVGDEAARDGGVSFRRALVQTSGDALVLPSEIFRREFQLGGALQSAVLRHQQTSLAQTSQTTMCNRLHSVEERLSRWLLMAHDRTQGDRLELTQEFLSQMLGARRSGVTIAAGLLRDAHAIKYTRGAITVADRDCLESCACGCYLELERLLRETGLFVNQNSTVLQ